MLIINSEDVREALRPLYGRSVELMPLQGGSESQAYLLVDDGQEFIARVNQSAAGFRKDAFASQHFNSASLPIPAVLSVGNVDDGHSYCITTRASGITLQDMPPEQIPRTLQSTVNVMRAISECDISMTRGFGPFDENGIAPYRSWRSYLQSLDRDWSDTPPCIRDRGIDSALAKLLSLSDNVPDVRHLVHGDFGSNNVLCDGASITGVIDWSEAMIGDPLYDVANIFFWRTWLDCMDQLAGFFEDSIAFGHDARSLLLCYQLHIGLREVYESARGENHPATCWAKARVEEILRQTQ